MNKRSLTLTNSKIDEICTLVRLGVNPSAAAGRCGINKNAWDTWLHYGRKHIANGEPTLQARLVKQLDAAKREAARINWDKIQQENPTAWLAMQATRLFSEELASETLTPAQQAQRQQLESDLYDAWFSQKGANHATPKRTE